jgi:hypothetical protein
MIEKNDNLASRVCKIHIVPVSSVESVETSFTDHSRTINLISGQSWEEVYGTPGSMKFEEPVDNSSSGQIFKQKVSCLFPGLDSDNPISFDNIGNKRYIVRITYNNGIMLVIGSIENPAMFSQNYTDEQGGRALVWSCNSPEPAFILNL